MSTEPSSLERAIEAEGGALTGVPVSAEQLDLLRDDRGRLPSDIFQRLRANAGPRRPGRPKGSLNKNSKQFARVVVERTGDPLMALAESAALPLDQFVELLLAADGSKEREDRLFEVAEATQRLVNRMLDDGESGRALTDKQIEKLTKLVETASDLTRTLKVKPGELALKAYVAQRDARRIVSEYVHSKMPVAIDVNTRADVILNIPGLTDAMHMAEYVEHPEISDQELAGLEYSPFEEVGGDAD